MESSASEVSPNLADPESYHENGEVRKSSIGSAWRQANVIALKSMQEAELILEQEEKAKTDAKRARKAQQQEQQEVQALFKSLESLAAAASEKFSTSGPQQALELLLVACSQADGQDESLAAGEDQVDATATSHDAASSNRVLPPPVAIARAASRVLLCMTFSQAGLHEEALKAAKEAMEVTDAVLPGIAEEAQRELSNMHGTPTKFGEDEVSKYNLATHQLLLERIAQLAVQARQCQALETEFINPDAGGSEEMAELHNQSLQIANQYLCCSNQVRTQAEKAHREWQMRKSGISEESLWPFNDQGVAKGAAVHAWRNHLSLARPHTTRSESLTEAGIGLSKHERLYQGLPPRVDTRERRRQGLSSSSQQLRGLRPDSGIRSMSQQAAQFSLDAAPSETSLVFEGEDDGLASGSSRELERAFSAPNVGLGVFSRDHLNTAPATTSTLGSTSSLWSKHHIKAGDLYSGSSPHSRELPKSASWQALRRTPVLFSMAGGGGGKAAWALRRAGKKRLEHDSHRINAFEDWRKNASGPKVNLKDQMLQTETGIQHFQRELKQSGHIFKNFWLKDEVTADDLWEDRTLYCGEGLRVLKKSRPTKMVTPPTPKAQELFREYGMTCPTSQEISSVYQELSTYRSLLVKSQDPLLKLMPSKRRAREDRHPKVAPGKFDSLKGLGGLLFGN